MKTSFAHKRAMVRVRRAFRRLRELWRALITEVNAIALRCHAKVHEQTKVRPIYSRSGKPLKSWQTW